MHTQLAQTAQLRTKRLITPEVQWAGDGILVVTMFLPTDLVTAEAAALELGRAMNLDECEVIHKQVMHPAEGNLISSREDNDVVVDLPTGHPPPPDLLSDEDIRSFVLEYLKVVAATVVDERACRARSSTSNTAVSRPGVSALSIWGHRCR